MIFRRSRPTAVAALCLALAAWWWARLPSKLASVSQTIPAAETAAPLPPTGTLSTGGFDRREKGAGASEAKLQKDRESRLRAVKELEDVVRGIHVDFDDRLHSPKFIASNNQFLSQAGGTGAAISPQQAARFAGNDHAEVRAFLAQHAALFGYGPEALNDAQLARDYVTPHNGLRTTVWQQQLEGVRVFESTLQAHVTRDGALVNLGSRLVPDVRAAAGTGTPNYEAVLARPPIDAPHAVSLAAAAIGDTVQPERVIPNTQPNGLSRRQSFRAPALLEPAAEYVWLPLDEGSLRLCWEVTFTSKKHGEMFRTLVDAGTGTALIQQRLTEYIAPASYRVFTSDSPTPMSPGLATPAATQPAQVTRELVTVDALNASASPNGWIDDGVMETRGNNVDAHLDLNADNIPDTPRPQSVGPNRVFDPPLDLTQAPNTYRDAAVVNLFYWANVVHDRYYSLGFTEAAGNFQVNNFGRGGLGNDAVQADAQDGSGTNNANFSTPADGSSGRMQMFLFTGPNPDRDGDFDQEVVIHELTHGLSNRLVGGGVGISALQPRGMGEGWSDFYGLCLLSESTDDPNGNYGAGAYASYQLNGFSSNYYSGIRRYPYSTDLLKNPLTFKDIDPSKASTHTGIPKSPLGSSAADEVHSMGEVWCVTLWEVRAALIAKLGAADGNDLVLRLVTDGMKLAPANPTFLQARDAILQAELVDTAGAHRNAVWSAFAKRGMGSGAVAPANSTATGVTENFDLPDALSVTPSALPVASGSIGGPFTPNAANFVLFNSSTSPVQWIAASSQGWLSLSETSGTLVPGGTVQIQATLNAAAYTLPSAGYSSAVTFTNVSSGITQTRPFALQVDFLYVPAFSEDFESGTLDPAYWTITGTGSHRTQITTANGPHASAQHLTMDTSSGAARNEATLTLNLTGRSNMVLRFWAKMFNDEPDGPPASPFIGGANFDGIALSTDGTTWYEIQGLRTLTADWQKFTVDLDAALAAHGLIYGSSVKIRFNHYDDTPISSDGFAFDDISVAEAVNRRLQVQLPASAIEGGASQIGTVIVTPTPEAPLTVSLASSDPSEVVVPATVTIPAGSNSASFTFSTPDDAELDGTQTPTVSVSSATYIAGSTTISIYDTESASLSLDIPPTTLEGAGGITGTVSVSAPPAQTIRVLLSSSEIADLLLPPYVDIPAGQTSAPFVITAVDDHRIDGPVTAIIMAKVQNWATAAASITIADNESTALTLSPIGALHEGDTLRNGIVSIAGTLLAPLTIQLSSSDPTEATVPATVTIPAGQTSISFAITSIDDAEQDGTQPVTFIASAPGFTDGTVSTTVADNEVHHLAVSGLSGSVIRHAAIAITVTAYDVNGVVITNFSGPLNFTATGAHGPVSVSQNGGSYASGTWTGQLTFDTFDDAIRLTVGAGAGFPATSDLFSVVRGPLDHLGWSPVGPQSVDTPFTATISAQDSGGNSITEFNGPVSLGVSTQGTRPLTGTATSSSGSGLNGFYTVGRVQSIYTPAEIGPSGLLTALELNLTSAVGNLGTLTIRLKHTTKSSNQAGWESSDFTVVYQATANLIATGWVKFPFLTPFQYDGVSNLIVDICHTSPGFGYGSSGAYQTFSASPPRRIYYDSPSAFPYGGPLTWSGNSAPYVSITSLPVLRFTGFSPPSPIRPSVSGNFTGGSWTGDISIPFATDAAILVANDGQGHTGSSAPFKIRQPTGPVGSGVIFSEDFESAALSSAWLLTGTNYYRTQLSTANTPHTGKQHLVMDSSSYYYPYGRNEATLTLDLSGMSGVTLNFWAKGAGTADSPPASPFINGADFDGMAISVDGTNWYEVQSLRNIASSWTQFTVDLDAALKARGLAYSSTFSIRFNHYGHDSFPYDGLCIDDFALASNPTIYSLRVTAPAQLAESGPPTKIKVTLPFALLADSTVALQSSAPAKLTVPAQVTIPAGQRDGYAYIQPQNDTLADGTKVVGITATSPSFPPGGTSVSITDNDVPAFTLSAPSSTVEGAGTVLATVSVPSPCAAPLTFSVISSDTTAVAVPASITLAAGFTSVALPLAVINDTKLDGAQTATITVSLAGSTPQATTITVEDNETHDLRLQPTTTPPAPIMAEGSGPIGFTLILPGTVTTATTVSFTSSNPARVVAPAPITISAGVNSGAANFTFPENAAADGSELITLTATAPGFNSATYSFTLLDNDPDHFVVSPIGSPQIRGTLVPITITAVDAGGTTLTGFSGGLTFSAGSVPVQPSITSFAGGVWSGSVRFDDFAGSAVLTVSDGAGHSGSSIPFDVILGSFVNLKWDAILSPQTPGSNIPVTVRAADSGGNVVPSINAPITVRPLTPSAALVVGQGTSTDDFLYPYYGRARAEAIYLPAELGGPRTLGGIALNLSSGANGQVLSNFTIRLKHTALSGITSSTGWDATGWTVVHQSTQTLNQTGWITFLFDVPFAYDGQSNLLVDFSFNNTTAPNSSASWKADYAYILNNYRAAYYYTSTAGDPLLWSGTSPGFYTDSNLPQARFLSLQPATPTLTSAQVINGLWQGTLSFPGSFDALYLEAVDSAGHRGLSNRLAIANPASATVSLPFSDGFESGTFSSAWTLTSTGVGRSRVLSANTPHTGSQHAVLDSNSGYSRAELTLALDLRGYTGLHLNFWAKRFGGSSDGPPTSPFTGGADFDGVAISADGNAWYEVQPLRSFSAGLWTQFEVDLDAAAASRGLAFNSSFRIRFNQYGYDYAPYDGVAIDDVLVTGNPIGRMRLTVPASLAENAAPTFGTVTLPAPASSPITVSLTSSSPLLLAVPPSVTVPTGATTATFALSPSDNADPNGNITVALQASAPGQFDATAMLQVLDNDVGTIALSIPSSFDENVGALNAILTVSPPPVAELPVTITSTLPGSIPSLAVKIPPGATSLSVPVSVLDDGKFTGPRSISLTASLPGWPSASASAVLNDVASNTLVFYNTSIMEGKTTNVSVYLDYSAGTDIVLTLNSADPSRLTVPATVTVPAGQYSVSVPLTATENTTPDGHVVVPVTVSGANLVSATANITIQDNELDHFNITTVPATVVRGAPFSFTASAASISGDSVSTASGVLTFSAVGDAGPIAVTPSSANFSGSSWSGSVTLGTFSENVRLTVSDSAGHTGSSAPFRLSTGPTTHYGWSNVASPQMAGQSITATINALDAGNNPVISAAGYLLLTAPPAEKIIGSGTNITTSYPLYSYFHDQRTQVIYLASEVGAAGTLSSLSLYVFTKPGQTLNNWTIRLKHTALSSYSTNTWDSSGWTTVYAKNETISQTGWVTFNFTTPFSYNGTSNLLVDFSFNNSSYTSGGAVRSFIGTGNRVLSAYTDSGYGDPLTWSGTTPYGSLNSAVPQSKLNSGAPGTSLSPAVVALNNGTWTGPLWCGAATSGASFIATDLSGITGQSNTFTVQTPPDIDTDGLPDFWESANSLAPGSGVGDNGALGDLDRDGISNLLEYALNLNPQAYGLTGLPSMQANLNPADDLRYLEFSFRRRLGAASITYLLETSADCKTWTADPSFYQLAGTPLPTGDGVTEKVTVRLLPALNNLGTPSRFIRLHVTAP